MDKADKIFIGGIFAVAMYTGYMAYTAEAGVMTPKATDPRTVVEVPHTVVEVCKNDETHYWTGGYNGRWSCKLNDNNTPSKGKACRIKRGNGTLYPEYDCIYLRDELGVDPNGTY